LQKIRGKYTTLSNARSQSEKFRESITPFNTGNGVILNQCTVYNDIYQRFGLKDGWIDGWMDLSMDRLSMHILPRGGHVMYYGWMDGYGWIDGSIDG